MGTPLDTVGGRTLPYLKTLLTATGTTQATAYPLVNNALHEFTTVASGSGAILPVPAITSEITITNSGGSTLLVYPQVGGTIANGSVNAAVSLTAGSSVTYWANSLTNWYALNAATTAEVGSGTVTNVTFTGDGITASATPSAAVTTTGTLDMTTATAAINTVVAGPSSGNSGPLVQRALVAADLPTNLILPTVTPVRYTSGPFLNIVGAGTAVANTTTETSIFTGATFRTTPVAQSLTIPANSIQAGQAIRMWFSGLVSGISSDTFQWFLLLGGTVIAETPAQSITVTDTGTAWVTYAGPVQINFPAVGSGGSVIAYGNFAWPTASTGAQQQFVATSGALTAAPVSINTTNALALDIRVQWGTASASNSFQLTSGYAEIVG
jgi:hypothetical protein